MTEKTSLSKTYLGFKLENHLFKESEKCTFLLLMDHSWSPQGDGGSCSWIQLKNTFLGQCRRCRSQTQTQPLFLFPVFPLQSITLNCMCTCVSMCKCVNINVPMRPLSSQQVSQRPGGEAVGEKIHSGSQKQPIDSSKCLSLPVSVSVSALKLGSRSQQGIPKM